MKAAQYITILLILVFGTVAIGAERATDPIVGNWIYHGKNIATFHPDGTCSYPSGLNGTWRYLNNPEVERKYEVIWKSGVFVESFRLSKDGKTLSGKNKKGVDMRVERTTEAPQ